MTSRVLVTGSGGALGAAFQAIAPEYPQYEFLFVTSKDGDLRIWEETRSLVKRTQPEFIIHLAAVSGGIGLNFQARMLRDNILMLFNILDAAVEIDLGKVIMTLSTGMYPAQAHLPLHEASMHNGRPHPSNYGYAFAKRLVDPAIKAYRADYGISAIGLIPNGIIGPYDNFSLQHAPMVPALIHRFYGNRHNDEELIVWGDGSPLREYTYAEDLARAYLWCLEYYDSDDCLNIGSTEENSVREIAYMISDILEIDRRRIVFDPTRPPGVHRKSTDNSKFLYLSDFHYTPFRQALEATISWFAQAYEGDTLKFRAEDKFKFRS